MCFDDVIIMQSWLIITRNSVNRDPGKLFNIPGKNNGRIPFIVHYIRSVLIVFKK